MKTTLVMVSSINGRITKGNGFDTQAWASTEDQQHFLGMLRAAKLIVMGKNTYQIAKKGIEWLPGQRRIVLTRSAKKFVSEEIPGKLEFTQLSPRALLQKLEKQGCKKVLLVGGGEINAAFFKAGLVDEIFLTIEPVVFGTGRPLAAEATFSLDLKLKSVKKLNSRGTLLLHYAR